MSEAATGEHLPAIDSLIYCVFLLVVIWEIAINITKKNKERKKENKRWSRILWGCRKEFIHYEKEKSGEIFLSNGDKKKKQKRA